MAETNLKEYLARLDNLLEKGNPTEVIHHCRHILQYYPKNAEAYRLLGRALVYGKSWREADEVLRRVLSVYPDDFNAHAGLSEIALADKRNDDAIWHLERAFEQEPNNQTVIEMLRELYRKFRREEHAKVQLTAGAVARQYVRNGLYEQALDTLQGALERNPDRVDLQLLLAQTYRDGGYTLESGETALKVLKTLPECLEANRILAELWLKEERPSDAQRYISRIQSVEPYLALSLAQGETVSNDAFKLDELDYRKVAEREIVNRTPDWLQQVDQAAENSGSADDLDWMQTVAPATRNGPPPAQASNFSSNDLTSDLPDDWFTGIDEKPAPIGTIDEDLFGDTNTPPRKRTGLTGLLSSLGGAPEDALEETPDQDFASLFEDDNSPPPDLFAESEPADDEMPSMDDLFADMGEVQPEAPKRVTGEMKETDPLAWLKESGIEVIDAPEDEPDMDLFDTGDGDLGIEDADAADPLAWLKGSGGSEMIVEDTPRARFGVDDDFPATQEDDDDPLAWLKDSGVQVNEAPKPAARAAQPAPAVDPLDWLSDDSALDEALSMEALLDEPTSTSEQPAARSTAAPADDLDWMQTDVPPTTFEPEEFPTSIDVPDWLSDASPAAAPVASVDEPSDDDFGWMNEAEPEPEAEADVPSWLSDAAPAAAPAAEADVPSWLSDDAPVAAPVASVDEPNDDDFGWMNEAEPEPEAEADVPSWLSDAAPAAAPVANLADEADDDMGWMREVEPEPEAEDDVPSWLSDASPAAPAVASAADEDDAGFEWMSEAEQEPEAEDDVPSWLSDASPATASVASVSDEADDAGFEWMSEAEPEPEAEADVPSWLSDSAPAAAVASVADDADDAGFEWMSETEAEPEAEADVPSWLSDSVPAAASVASVADEDDAGFEWMSEAEPEPEAEADVPSWLSDSAPAAASVASVADDADDAGFEWMSEAEPEPEAEADVPSWLSDAAPAAAVASVADDADDAGFEWMSEAEPEPEAEADVPSWLSDAAPAAAVASVSDEADDAGFEWMSETEAEPEAEADVPSWLSDAAPAAAVASVADDADAGFEWMSEADPEPEVEQPVASAVPNWLSDMQPDEAAVEENDELLSAPVAETPNWLSSVEDDEPEAEAQPMSDIPNWLSENEPDKENPDDSGFAWDDADSEPGTADQPDWLTAMQPEASVEDDDMDWNADADAEPEAEPAGDMPDWLSAMRSDEPEAEAEPAADMPDWLGGAQPEEDEEVAPVRASASDDFQWDAKQTLGDDNVPDWLSAVQPEEDEPAAVSDEFAFEDEPEAEPAGDLPNWLTSMKADEPEVEEAEPAVASNDFQWDEADAQPEAVAADQPDWLAALDADDEAEVEEPAAEAADMPDWLSTMQPEDEPAEAAPVAATLDDNSDFEWDADDAPAEAGETPDWLRSIQSGEDEAQPEAAVAESGEFNWIDDINAAEEPDNNEFVAAELDVPEEAEPAVVGNAPDWLNAMVPGLDVDFDAPEDEPIEQEFLSGRENRLTPRIQETPRSRAKREFDWLVDIVDSETRPMKAIQDRQSRRFSFTRQPAWLRPPTEKSDPPAKVAESDDIDLPPWLQ